jgi:hypothetical protein
LDCGQQRRIEVKKILLTLVLIAAPAAAQVAAPAPNSNEVIQKLVMLKYADPRAVKNLLGNFGLDVNWDPNMKVLALSGHRANVTTAEEAIKQLDVPGLAQKDIDFSVYFLVGGDLNPQGSAIPPDLQSTVAALKTAFPYKSYVLLDVLSLRTQSGVGASSTGQLGGGRLSTFRVNSATLEDDGKVIRLNNLHAGVRFPVTDKDGRVNYLDTGISTDVVNVKEGQKLVVGRSSLSGPETALFLVLIAKVAQ